MSLAAAQGTSLFITMRRADIEYRLMMITNNLQKLANAASQQSQDLLNRYQSAIAAQEDTDDPSVAADTMSSAEFTAAYNNMSLMYQAREKVLTTEKQNLETEEKALSTEEESVDKMIESNLKNFKYMQ